MDLKIILTRNKSKTDRKIVRKPVEIADQDRPYSLDALNNQEKTSNKLATNWQQTSNKLATNWQQTSNKLATNWQQTSNNICNKLATNWQQTGNKLATNCSLYELVGLQREIIIFICNECKNSRSKITDTLSLEYIANCLKRRTGAVRTTIQRLQKKGYLCRTGSKNGRGGWTQYEVTDHIYHEVLRNETSNKLATNWQQTSNKLATNAPSSSSSNITTTTTEPSEEWNFNITPYARFGFTASQIKQLSSLNVISAIDVEQSLIEFSYDLDNNTLPPIKTNKTNFLMGLFRAGHLYVSEGFKNEQEAIISEMAKRAEGKRKKRLEEKFLAWEASLTDEIKKEIEHKLPTQLMVLHRAHGINNTEVKNWFFSYFLKHIDI
jgi:predicted transcriptional regulator